MAKTDITAINAKSIVVNGTPLAGSDTPSLPTNFDGLDADAVLALKGTVLRGSLPPGGVFTNYDTISVNSLSVAEVPYVSSVSFLTQPTVAPSSGTAGQTFTATPGTVSNGNVTSREWRLAGNVVSTALTYVSTVAGALTYQEFAGSVASNLIAVTVTAAAGPATFSMTQLADSNRTYQRQSMSGGSFGKGAGTVPVAVNVTVAGGVKARCRAASDGTTILQPAWQAVGNASTGSQTLPIPGVEARKEAFFLDLSGDGTTWTNGTTPIRMGGLTATDGQSLSVRFFAKANDTATYASLGITPSANSRVFGVFNDPNELGGAKGLNQYNAFPGTPIAWTLPGQGIYDSAFACEYLRYMEAFSGVAWGLIGAPAGATAIAEHAPGQPIYVKNQQVFSAAGNAWEEFIWFQGHQDGSNGTSYSAYMAGLSSVINGYNSANTFSGCRVRVATIPYNTNNSYGSNAVIADIRRAGRDWAAANSATYHALPDFETYDGVHQAGAGAIKLGVHFARAARPVFGLAGSDVGPTISSVTRDGTNFNVVFALPTGATALVLTGAISPTVSPRLFAYEPGTTNLLWSFGNATTGGNTLTFVDPFPEQAFDLYLDYALPIGINGATGIVRDNHIETDEAALGITIGRATVQSVAPFNVPAFATRVNRPMTMTSPAYVAGTTGFGQRLNAGYGVRANFPSPPKRTVEIRFDFTAQPNSLEVFYSEDQGRVYAGLNGAGNLVINTGSTIYTGSTNLVGTGEHKFELGLDSPTGTAYAFLDGTLLSTGGFAAGAQDGQASPQIEVRGISGNNFQPTAANRVDELALWKGVRHTTSFTAPTAPYTGSESGLIALYHFDSSGADATV